MMYVCDTRCGLNMWWSWWWCQPYGICEFHMRLAKIRSRLWQLYFNLHRNFAAVHIRAFHGQTFSVPCSPRKNETIHVPVPSATLLPEYGYPYPSRIMDTDTERVRVPVFTRIDGPPVEHSRAHAICMQSRVNHDHAHTSAHISINQTILCSIQQMHSIRFLAQLRAKLMQPARMNGQIKSDINN